MGKRKIKTPPSIQFNRDLRLYELKCFIKNLQKSGRSLKKIVNILLIADCSLIDVVHLQNAKVTRAFLCERDNVDYFDSAKSVYLAMTLLDVKTTEVLIRYGSGAKRRKTEFWDNLVAMTTCKGQINFYAVKVFLEQIIIWDILDDKGYSSIDFGVFQKADKVAVQLYLQCNIDEYVEKVFKSSLLPSLFANPNKGVIGLLKNRKFDLNTPGTYGYTPLHFAARILHYDNMKFLLDRGAEPNSQNFYNYSPLYCGLYGISDEAKIKKCIELLLQYKADLFLLDGRLGITFFDCVFRVYGIRRPGLKALTLTHITIRVAAGPPVDVPDLDEIVHRTPGYRSLHASLNAQLAELKKHNISKDLTMFTIISRTGKELFGLVNETDRIIVSKAINKYEEEGKLFRYFIRTLREHLRQLENIVKCENTAISVICKNIKILAPYHIVVKKIISYFTCLDLLKFL